MKTYTSKQIQVKKTVGSEFDSRLRNFDGIEPLTAHVASQGSAVEEEGGM